MLKNDFICVINIYYNLPEKKFQIFFEQFIRGIRSIELKKRGMKSNYEWITMNG